MTATKTKPAKKTKAAKTESRGLTAGQVRILQALAKLNPQAGMTRSKIAEKAMNNHVGRTFSCIGPTEEKQRTITEKRTGYPSLLTLKAVSTAVVQSDEGGPKERIFRITATGRSLLEKTMKAQADEAAAKKEAEKAKAARLKEREKRAAAKAGK